MTNSPVLRAMRGTTSFASRDVFLLPSRNVSASSEQNWRCSFETRVREDYSGTLLGTRLGFQPSQIDQGTSDKGEEYFYCDLVSSARLTPQLVYCESLLMHLLGECYGAEYDGWGTLVHKEPGAVEQ